MNEHNKRLWQEACGPTPDAFVHRMRQGLMQRAAQPAPRRMRPMLAAALALVVLLGGAYALERLGLLNTLHRTLQKDLQPRAGGLVNTQIDQQAQQPALARFAVEEAVFDGRQAYFTLRVQPTEATKTLLMDQGAEAAWAYDWQAKDSPFEGTSFMEKADAAGQTLVQAEVWDAAVNGAAMQPQLHGVAYQEQDLLYTLSLPVEGERAAIRLNLLAAPVDTLAEAGDRGTLDFTLTKSPEIRLLRATEPVALPQAGIHLTHCQMELTPIASYLTLRYALAPEATPLQGVNFNDGLWADWLDAQGQPRQSADSVNALRRLPDGQVELLLSFGALKEAPAQITLSLYNGITKERFDQVTLGLTPMEER